MPRGNCLPCWSTWAHPDCWWGPCCSSLFTVFVHVGYCYVFVLFWPRVWFPLLMTGSFYHVLVSYSFPVNENILLYSRHVRSIYSNKDHNGKYIIHVRSIYSNKDHNGKYIISVLIQGWNEGLKWKFNKICDQS